MRFTKWCKKTFVDVSHYRCKMATLTMRVNDWGRGDNRKRMGEGKAEDSGTIAKKKWSTRTDGTRSKYNESNLFAGSYFDCISFQLEGCLAGCLPLPRQDNCRKSRINIKQSWCPISGCCCCCWSHLPQVFGSWLGQTSPGHKLKILCLTKQGQPMLSRILASDLWPEASFSEPKSNRKIVSMLRTKY